MSTTVVSKESTAVWQPPPAAPLDEAVWQTWLAKGRTRERHGAAVRVEAVKWVSITALLVASAALWPQSPLFDIVIRFLVSAGAIVMMLDSLSARRYAFAAAFGALALAYNPPLPLFSFTGNWQRALLLSSATPFVLSLSERKMRSETR